MDDAAAGDEKKFKFYSTNHLGMGGVYIQGKPLSPSMIQRDAQLENSEHSISVSVKIEGLSSPAARDRISEYMQRFAEDLADKVKEVEREERVVGAENPEITASTVIKAYEKLKDRSIKPKSSVLDLTLSIISPVFAGATGVLGSYLKTPLQAGVFGAVAAIAIIVTVVTVLRKGGKYNA